MLLEGLSSARRGEADGGRRLSGCRDGEFRKRRLAPFPGHLEHKVRPPASLEQGAHSGRLLGKGSAFRGPGQRDADCTMARSSGICACSRR